MRSGFASLRAIDLLGFAAAPVFGLMALLTTLADDGHAFALCTQQGPAHLLAGMAPMYGLMALFHLSPWFRARKPS